MSDALIRDQRKASICAPRLCLREIRERLVFMDLLKICPGLETRLTEGSEEDVEYTASLVSQSCADDLSFLRLMTS